MPDYNYLNPASMKPDFNWKPSNDLAGYYHYNQSQDYERLLAQQERMQAMAEEERRIKLGETRKDIPLRDLQREGQMNIARGENPFLGQLGATTAQAKITDNKIKSSPEAYNAGIRGYLEKTDNANWDKIGKEASYAASILRNGIALMEQGGPLAVQKYIADKQEEAGRFGFQLPKEFQDPKNWPYLFEASLNTVKQLQELQQIKSKGEYDLEGRRISGESMVRASQARPQQDRPHGDDQHKNRIIEAIRAGDTSEQTLGAFEQALTSEWIQQNKNLYEVSTMVRPDSEVAKRVNAAREAAINAQFSALGVQRPRRIQNRGMGVHPNGQPATPPGTRPSLEESGSRYELK